MGRKPASESVSRRDILIASSRILGKKGYDATTMRDIAAEVNMTAASLYHHFKGKDFLLLSVLELGLSILLARIETVAQMVGTPSEKLTAMIRSNTISITEDTRISTTMAFEFRSLMRVYADRIDQDNDDSMEFNQRVLRLMAVRDRYDGLFREVVLAGITCGEFRPVDVPVVVRTMLGSHNWMTVWFKSGGRLNSEELSIVLVDLWLAALRVHPQQDQME